MFRINKRTQKAKHNTPQPSPLDLSTSPIGDASQKSLGFHDAYVESATNLLAAVTDIVRTSQLQSSRSSGSGQLLEPSSGRPRSHTAPPTPVVEAGRKDPVELLGSLPSDVHRRKENHESVRNTRPAPLTTLSSQEKAGLELERPHSSPTERLPSYFTHQRSNSENQVVSEEDLISAPAVSPRSRTFVKHRASAGSGLKTPQSARPLQAVDRYPLIDRKQRRPSLSLLQSSRNPQPEQNKLSSARETVLSLAFKVNT